MTEPKFSTIFNFRNATAQLPLYRSAALDHASKQDLDAFHLFTDVAYRVDLRSPLEKLKSDHEPPIRPIKGAFLAKRITNQKDLGIVDNSVAKATAKQLRFSDVFRVTRKKNVATEPLVTRQTNVQTGKRVETFYVNFLNARYRDNVIWDRSTLSERIKMFTYMITFRFDGLIRFIGAKFLSLGGLEGSYRDFIDYSGDAIGKALQLITECLEKRDGAVAWNCYAGKDRSGIVSALVKYIIDDPMEDIISDYNKSEAGLLPIIEDMIREFSEQGLPEEFAKAPSIVMENTLSYITERYGSIEGYLDSIGFDASWRARLNASSKT
jgi:hypothetical protein